MKRYSEGTGPSTKVESSIGDLHRLVLKHSIPEINNTVGNLSIDIAGTCGLTDTKEMQVLLGTLGWVWVWITLPSVMGVQPHRTHHAIENCRSIPGDTTWPSQSTWNRLNRTVGGRLVATVPQAAVCHSRGYGPLKQNATACSALRTVWNNAMT